MIVREALAGLEAQIAVAFIFGSVAQGRERAESDLDLFVIGTAGYSLIAERLYPVDERLGRKVQVLYFDPTSADDRASLRKRGPIVRRTALPPRTAPHSGLLARRWRPMDIRPAGSEGHRVAVFQSLANTLEWDQPLSVPERSLRRVFSGTLATRSAFRRTWSAGRSRALLDQKIFFDSERAGKTRLSPGRSKAVLFSRCGKIANNSTPRPGWVMRFLVGSIKKFSALLALLYTAPLDDALWQTFLTDLCGALGARQCFYVRADAPSPPSIVALGGPPVPADMVERYNKEYGQIDPYGPALAPKARAAPIFAEEVVGRADLERTDFYNLVLRPTELHHAIFLPAILEPDHFDAFTIWRSVRQKPFDRSSERFLELLLPHLQSALRTRRALTACITRARLSERALDASRTATIILDAHARIVHCNAAAAELLRQGDGIVARGGGVAASDHTHNGRLRALIATASAAGGGTPFRPGGAMTLPRSSRKRPLYILVSPLRVDEALIPAHVLVQVGDPERQTTLPGHVLRPLYQLTPSEAEIANALVAGRSVDEIAELRGVTSGTVRIQLKTILQKTGARRQSELMRLLLSIPRVKEP